MDLTAFLATYSTPILGLLWFGRELLSYLSRKDELRNQKDKDQNQSTENGYKIAVDTFREELKSVRDTVEHEREQNKEMGKKIYYLESEIRVLQSKVDQYEKVLFDNGLGKFVQQNEEMNSKIDTIVKEVKKRKTKEPKKDATLLIP